LSGPLARFADTPAETGKALATTLFEVPSRGGAEAARGGERRRRRDRDRARITR